jgi:hypothetical protein
MCRRLRITFQKVGWGICSSALALRVDFFGLRLNACRIRSIDSCDTEGLPGLFPLHRHPRLEFRVPLFDRVRTRGVLSVTSPKTALHSDYRPTLGEFEYAKSLLPLRRRHCGNDTTHARGGRFKLNFHSRSLIPDRMRRPGVSCYEEITYHKPSFLL